MKRYQPKLTHIAKFEIVIVITIIKLLSWFSDIEESTRKFFSKVNHRFGLKPGVSTVNHRFGLKPGVSMVTVATILL